MGYDKWIATKPKNPEPIDKSWIHVDECPPRDGETVMTLGYGKRKAIYLRECGLGGFYSPKDLLPLHGVNFWRPLA